MRSARVTRGVIGGLVLGVVGCPRGETPPKVEAASVAKADPTPDSKTPPARDVPPATVAPQRPAATTADGGAERATERPSAAAVESWRSSISVQVPNAGGGPLLVAVDVDTDRSVLWARRTTDGGEPKGEAVKLTSTAGSVEALDAGFDGTTLWVAWRAPANDGRGFIAVAGFDPGLVATHEKRVVQWYSGGMPIDGELEVLARTLGGAAVASIAGSKRCDGLFPGEGPAECTRLLVALLAADGEVRRIDRLLDGGDPSLDDLVEVGSGVVTSFHVWHGGPLTDVAYIPDDPAKEPSSLALCQYPPIDVAFVDGTILGVCPDPDNGSAASRSASCKAGKAETCGSLVHADLQGVALPPSVDDAREVPLSRIRTRCVGGRAVSTLSWAEAADRPAGRLVVDAESLQRTDAPPCGS